MHVGLYDLMIGEDAKLEGAARISRASTLSAQERLRRCFPADGPAPETCTIVDFGSGVGGTARLAAKQHDWKVCQCFSYHSRWNLLAVNRDFAPA